MSTRLLIVVLVILSIITSAAMTFLLTSDGGSSNQSVSKDQIKDAVAEFIEENPEAIIEGLRRAQVAKATAAERESANAAKKVRPELEEVASDPQKGDKNAKINIVAFHDHNCGYCRRTIPTISKILKEDKDVRFVMKDFPILGPTSVTKSQASLAVSKLSPEKWYDFYVKLGESNARTEEQILEVASKVIGLPKAAIKSTMESKEINNKISENRSLGERLNITGTPVFVINGTVIRGAVGYDAFKAAIEKAKSNS